MKVYLSSTFADLKRHRMIVGRSLRKAHYEVVMMEDYVARDQTVEFACRGDVVKCDAYVGIFAWRYGCIPLDDNPERWSVTEMEYLAAGSKPMTRLTFLLKDSARWPKEHRDADLSRINELRSRLKKHCSAYFATADELAIEVLTALRVHECTNLAQQLEAIDVMLKAQQLGPSYMMNIQEKLSVLGEVPLVELRVAPTPWWNTRLFLIAALAKEFGRVRAFVFLDDEGRFLALATPDELRHRLAQRWPLLELAYSNFRREVPDLKWISSQLWRYPMFVNQAFGTDEQIAKHEFSARELQYELGIAHGAEVVNVDGKGQCFLQQEILGRQTPFVALIRDGQLEGLVDRVCLSQRVAQVATARML